MKQNLLKVLLLSMMTVSLVACGGETSSTPTEQPSESSTPVEDSSTPDEVVDENPPVIEISRRIFIEGEDVKPYITRFDMWSPILGGYKPKLDNFRVVMPETCPNGEATVTLVSGKEKAQLTIYYYESVEAAVANTEIDIPEDTSDLFYEEDYIDDGELTFDVFKDNGVLYASNEKMNGYVNRKANNVTWSTQQFTIWNNPEKLVPSVYDETKLTIEHYVEGKNNYYNCSYLPTNDLSSLSSMKSYELISDANGNILYFAPIEYSQGSWPNIATGEGYWSSIKDYTQNPVFVFADDFDPETNPHAYQKVMPEGGSWIIGINNRGEFCVTDKLWSALIGEENSLFNNYASYFMVTMEEEKVETALMNGRVKNKLNDKSIYVYGEADTRQRYAYYSVLAEQSGDETKKSYREAIREAIIMQQLPEVKAEPVLYEYYESVTTDKLDEWAALFAE